MALKRVMPLNLNHIKSDTNPVINAIRSIISPQKVSAPKGKISGLALRHFRTADSRLYLFLDIEMRRMIIGDNLSDAEKEWLFQVLQEWLGKEVSQGRN